jgi:hypothetical protein
MSGALVRKTITHAHWDPLHKVNEYGIYWADAVDLHIASLKREHEQQLAALQAEREDAQASFQHALKYSGECNTKLAALEADRDRLLAENTALRNLANNLQPGPISEAMAGTRYTRESELVADRDRLRAALALARGYIPSSYLATHHAIDAALSPDNTKE